MTFLRGNDDCCGVEDGDEEGRPLWVALPVDCLFAGSRVYSASTAERKMSNVRSMSSSVWAVET